MALKGIRALADNVMLTGWDATQLAKEKLQDGTTFEQLVSELNTAIVAINSEIAGDPIWAALLSFTDQPTLSYDVGGESEMGINTEYGEADLTRREVEGHMLPKRDFDFALGWTWKYLKRARIGDCRRDIRNAVAAVRNTYRKAVLGRLLKRGDDSGAGLLLGSGGYSPGFATTAGSTNVDFDPPDFRGNIFANTHEHYQADAGGYTNAIIANLKAELREHGHEPPFLMLASPSDETQIQALTEFVPVAQDQVAYGALQDLAQLDPTREGGAYYIGVHTDIAIAIMNGMPQYYGFVWKTYGPNHELNPIRVRLEDGLSVPNVIAMPDPRSGGGAQYPLQKLMLYLELGVGVGDRTNGTTQYTNSGTWADGVAA